MMNSKDPFTKFLISRRCNLSIHQLNVLNDPRFLSFSYQLLTLKKNRCELANLLVAALYEFIPLAAPCFQKPLVKLKRDIYNGRKLKHHVNDILVACNLNALIETMNQLQQSHEDIETIEKNMRHIYEDYVIHTRKALKKLCANENFLKSLQLSGRRLVKKVQEYQASPLSNLGNKKNRQTQDTIISYLYRMALNSAPFAAFTTVQAHIQSQDYPSVQNLNVCLTSRTLIQWFANQCSTLPFLKNHLLLKLNTTINHNGDAISFFTRANELSKNMFGGEKFIKINNSKTLTNIIGLIGDRQLSKLELIEELNLTQESQEMVGNFIENLIEIGLLERKLPIPDLTIRYAAKMADVLQQYSDPLLQTLAQFFAQIHDIELQFSHASIAARELLLKTLRTCLDSILNLLHLEDPGLDYARNFLYEDCGALVTDAHHQVTAFSQYTHELGVLSRILPIFDDHLIEQISLYHLYKKIYPESQNTKTSLLEFYKIFAKIDVQDLSKIMSGASVPAVDQIKQLRSEWLSFLQTKIKDTDADVLILKYSDLDEFIRQIPSFFQSIKSIIFYLQKNDIDQSVVFNGASTGYGTFFSRFCLIEESLHDTPITNALIHAMAEHHDLSQMVDLTSVLGINTNLHSNIFNQCIEYPGCDASHSSKAYHLNDLEIRADDQHQRLVLVDRNTNKEIFFRPLNFLLPSMGPCLYRFLYLFCPYLNHKVGFWQKYLEHFNDEKNTVFLPQLRIGKLILDRKTWKFSSHQLPRLVSMQAEIGVFYQQILEWFLESSLPQRVFFSQMIKKSSNKDWVSTMKNHMHISQKAKMRNSQFVDLNNPILLKIFSKSIEDLLENDMVLQECLPNIDYFESSNHYVEEYLIQYNCVS